MTLADDDAIFVRIAAYREFDLVPTLRDMIANAADPDRLRICICWQHAPDETLAEFASDPRVDVIDVHHMDSLGMCWARNLIQQRWDGEAYTLGLDGHHRFVPGWDGLLVERIRLLQDSGSPKPIIGCYAPSFDPTDDPDGRSGEVWLLGVDRFEERGVLFLRPYIPETLPEAPVPCRFWSGHFNFTVGQWNIEVPTDPEAYFLSEEIVMAVRSWTHGYDLFNPERTILWHEYSRSRRVCHWDEHPQWGAMNDAAIDDYKTLFGVDGRTPDPDYAYGFGTVRSLADYERFAGIDFRRRAVQQFTFDNGIAPNPVVADADWERSLCTVYFHTVRVPRRLLDRGCDLWSVEVADADGNELHRYEHSQPDLEYTLASQSGPLVNIEIRFASARLPASWRVRPHTAESGWLEGAEHPWISS